MPNRSKGKTFFFILCKEKRKKRRLGLAAGLLSSVGDESLQVR